MVKRIRTLLTLFLLVMGTTMSWAEFKDFEINLTEAMASAGNSSQISSAYLPEGVSQIFYSGTGRDAAYNGGQHGWQFAAFQFAVDGPVDIIIGGCQHSNVKATVTDANGSFSEELDTKNIGCGGVAIYKYKGKATTLKVYCGQYCPTIKVQNPTKEDFVASWDWTKEPEALNKQINYSVGWLSADNGISMYVDASVSKLYGIGRNNAQFNKNARLLVPVYGADDEITVIGYGGKYTGFSIHGKVYENGENAENIKVNAEDVEQGYIVVTSTADNKYLNSVTLKHTASAQTVSYVKVSYYNTDGESMGEEQVVEEGSALKFKYGASDVTVSSGKQFRGWYDGKGESAKPVQEGIALVQNTKLYAKATAIEKATTTSTHTYDLTKANWYQHEHDLIEINGGELYQDGSHGWIVGKGSTIKLSVAGDALITVYNCEYAHETTDMTLTDKDGNEIGVASAKAKKDGDPVTFKYSGGKTDLTLAFDGVAYVHKITVEHFVPVAFKPFKINFRTNPYTVIIPEGGKLPDNVDVTGGAIYDGGDGNYQHGYQNVTMNVCTDRPVKFYIGGCNFTNKTATVSVDGGNPISIDNKTACDNISSYDHYATYIHKGTENAILKFNLGEYCPYIIAEELIDVEYDEATRTFNVAANNADQLKEAIKEANAKKGNVTIYLPNGTYDLGTDINTEVKADNIAIIGESRDGVIIKNSPKKQGLGTSATLKNTSTGLYLQDLTIQCYAPYEINGGVGAEVGVALWERGTKTICKNVYLKGKQDTYYSNGAEGMIAYFEGGKIEGAVDFICGSGNVLFNSVTLNVVNGTNSGNVISAPSTYSSESGYLFANCRVTGNDSYYLARGWQAHGDASPAFTFIVTDSDNEPKCVDWAESIMDGSSPMTRRFAAYKLNNKGQVVAYPGKKDTDANFMVVTKANLRNFAGDWDPAAIISQHKPIKTNGAGWASYTAFTDVQLNGQGVKAYVAKDINANSVTLESLDGNKIPAGTPVFIYGAQSSKYYVEGASGTMVSNTNLLKPVLFDTTIGDGSNAFVLGTRDGVCGLYSVNSTVLIPAGKCYLDATGYSLAKDELEIVIAEAETTGIGNVVADVDADAAKYNLAGQKVGNGYKGIVVRKDGKKYLAK